MKDWIHHLPLFFYYYFFFFIVDSLVAVWSVMRAYALSETRDSSALLPLTKNLHLSKFDMFAFLLVPSHLLVSACQQATLSFLSPNASATFDANFAHLKQLKAITFNSYLIAIACDSGALFKMSKSSYIVMSLEFICSKFSLPLFSLFHFLFLIGFFSSSPSLN